MALTDDFITSVSVIDQGQRLVFAEDAVAFEPPARSGGDEFGRKVRIMTRGLRGTLLMRHLMDPRRTGFYAVHCSGTSFSDGSWSCRSSGCSPSDLALLGRRSPSTRWPDLPSWPRTDWRDLGLLARDRPIGRRKELAVPAYFVLVNAAALKAIIDVARGRRIDRWDHVLAAPRPGQRPPPARAPVDAAAPEPGTDAAAA